MIESPSTSNLGSSNWIADIPGMDNLTLRLTKFVIPEVNAGVTSIGNRTEFVMQTSGDHITYDNLVLEFILEENIYTYIQLYKWMRQNAHDGIETPSSIFLHVISNEKKFQGVQLEFLEAFPISLTEVNFETMGEDTALKCTVSFAYSAFDFLDHTDRN